MNALLKDLKEMRHIQKEVAKKVVLKNIFRKPITSIAGIDTAFLNDLAFVVCIMTDYNSLKIKTKETLMARLNFPYIPTLLSFREGPPIINLINTIDLKPDIFLINAQGIAHPMQCGCASHIGVLTGVPTIGVTARNLCGSYYREPREVGEYFTVHYGRKAVGWILKSKEGCRPIFISPGHKVSLTSSLEIVMKCLKNHKFPEPLSFAHTFANEEKRKCLNIPNLSSTNDDFH